MKKLLIILLSALSLIAFAQEKKTVAVLDPICRDNSVNPFFQQMVRGAMESAVTASSEYEAYDRSAFDQIQKEQAFQRTGAVNDSQIKQMGEMAGVDYVLVSEVSAYEGYLSAIVKILNVTTGKYDKSVDDYMQLEPAAVKSKCRELATSLFGTIAKNIESDASAINNTKNSSNASNNGGGSSHKPYSPNLDKFAKQAEPQITEECIINTALFNEAVKNKQYDDAWEPWWQVYTTCPNCNKAVYTRGAELVEWKISHAQNQREYDEYRQLLMDLYDKRLLYFGNDSKYPKAYILGQKGVSYCDYYKEDLMKDCAYEWLKQSINGMGEKSQLIVLKKYAELSYQRYKSNTNKYSSVFADDYRLVSQILGKQATDKSNKNAAHAREVKDLVDKMFIESGVRDY